MLKSLLLKLKDVLIFDEEKRNNQYLNEARDIQDLEYRMRQLDNYKVRSRNKNLYFYS